MRLLLDAMISAKVGDRLVDLGVDAAAIDGDPTLIALPDAAVLAMAQRERRVTVTENVRHFRPLAAGAVESGDGHFGVIHVASSRHGMPHTAGARGNGAPR